MPDRAWVVQVAEATARCDVTVWGFGVGTALTALVRAGELLDRPDLIDRVERVVGPSLTSGSDPTDHLIAVEVMKVLAAARPGPAYDLAERRFVKALTSAPRPVRGRPAVHRPDKDPWHTTIWVDCLHTDGPGLTALGLVDRAVALSEEACAALQRGDGLFDHGYDVATGQTNGVAWGRGQGWALLGLTGVLAHTEDPRLLDRLRRLVAALVRYERDGRWGAVLDRPDAAVEPSTSAYVALAIGHAVRRGILDAEASALADRAWSATLAMTVEGVLPTSDATPVGPVTDYLDRPLGLRAWGQGPLLATALDRLGAVREVAR